MRVSVCFVPLYHLGGGKGGSLRKLEGWMLRLGINAGMRQGGGGQEWQSLEGGLRTLSLKAVSEVAGLITLYFSMLGAYAGLLSCISVARKL